jgi:hypothetical protein
VPISTGAAVSTVASRDPARARSFAATFGIPAPAPDYAAAVARDAGVSIYTVSATLSGSAPVSPELRARVAASVALLLFSDQTTKRLERDAAAIDLVIGHKGSPLQLVMAAVFHADAPAGNIPSETVARLQADPRVQAAQYLEQHQIVPLFEQLAQALIFAKPDDPKAFLIAKLQAFKGAANLASPLHFFAADEVDVLYDMYDIAKRGMTVGQCAEALKALGIEQPPQLPAGAKFVSKAEFKHMVTA